MQIVMAGFDKFDPANACFFLAVPSTAPVGQSTHHGQVGFPPFREIPVYPLKKGVSVVRENILHQRTRVVRKFGVVKS
jgi:hypothetical protein